MATSEINRLFPFYIALYNNDKATFKYFWDQIGDKLWKENTFESLFKLLAKNEATEFLTTFFKSPTTLCLF